MRRARRTQKQRAKGNLLLLLPLLTLLVLLSSRYLVLLPQQSIRYEECYAWTGETEIISHTSTKYGTFYLSANENALLVTPFHRGLRTTPHQNGSVNVGWYGWSEATACDLTQQTGPLFCHLFTAQLPGGEGRTVTQLYGRVDVAGAVSIVGQNPNVPTLSPLSQTLIRGRDGHLYFWFLTGGTGGAPGPVCTELTLLDRYGNPLGQYRPAPLHPFLYV